MSRNGKVWHGRVITIVTSREGRVSRNLIAIMLYLLYVVTSREGRVSRNGLKPVEVEPPGGGSRPARDV